MSLTKSSAAAFDLSQRVARTRGDQPAAAAGRPEGTPTTGKGGEGAKRGKQEPDDKPRLRTFFVSPEIALRVRQQVLREPGRRQRVQERWGYDGMPADRVSSASGIVRGLLLYWLEHRDVLDETLRRRRDGQQDESHQDQAENRG